MAETRQPLAVVDMSRTEFGYYRTRCSCDECVENCRHLSGQLIPADVARLHQATAKEGQEAWALEHLAASPGAVAKNLSTGQTFLIPTLVPRRLEDGSCHWLTADGLCAVHAVSPMGCAFFDHSQSKIEADERSRRSLQVVAADWSREGPYSQLWQRLNAAGQTVEPVWEARRRLTEALTGKAGGA